MSLDQYRVHDLWDVARVQGDLSDGEVAALAHRAAREMRRALDRLDGLEPGVLIRMLRTLGADEAIQDAVMRSTKAAKEVAEAVVAVEHAVEKPGIGTVVEAVKETVEAVKAVEQAAEPVLPDPAAEPTDPGPRTRRKR